MQVKSAPRKLNRTHVSQAEKSVCEDSFYDFIKIAWKHIDPDPFIDNWHVETIANHLQAVAEGRFNRLLINVPPGCAKSIIVGVMFPAWLWIKDPSKRIISAANSIDLATRDSLRCRELITSTWYQAHWPTPLRADENKKTSFINMKKGARVAMALTSMTGSRGNIVIVDDPHTVDSAKSKAEREKTVNTFMRAVPNRLNDLKRDAIIVIMQRLHEEDVAGSILKKPNLGYVHLCIPMTAEDPIAPTAIGWQDEREPGELMFPSKFPQTELDALKESLGVFEYAGQYQQRPAPETDGYFERQWFKRFRPDELPRHINLFMTSDHAPSGTGDYNVIRVWGVDHKRHLWLVRSFRKKCGMEEAFGIKLDDGRLGVAQEGALAFIKEFQREDSPYGAIQGWFAENDNTWISNKGLVETVMMDQGLSCYIQELPLRGAGDKKGKASAYRAMASNGVVHLPEGDVGDDALEEYVMFPVGKHDDQVDADSAIARVLNMALPATVPDPPASQTRPPDYGAMTKARFTGDVSDVGW